MFGRVFVCVCMADFTLHLFVFKVFGSISIPTWIIYLFAKRVSTKCIISDTGIVRNHVSIKCCFYLSVFVCGPTKRLFVCRIFVCICVSPKYLFVFLCLQNICLYFSVSRIFVCICVSLVLCLSVCVSYTANYFFQSFRCLFVYLHLLLVWKIFVFVSSESFLFTEYLFVFVCLRVFVSISLTPEYLYV